MSAPSGALNTQRTFKGVAPNRELKGGKSMVSGLQEGVCPHGKPGMKILGIFMGYGCEPCVQRAVTVVEEVVEDQIAAGVPNPFGEEEKWQG